MITSIASSKGADWVDNNFDNLLLATKYTFNNLGKNVTLSMNGSGTLSEFCDNFKKIKNGEILLNSIDDVIKLGINSVDDLMKLGVNSVDDLAKLKVTSIDDLAKIGIKNADDLAKLGIDSSDLKNLGIDSKVFEGGGDAKFQYRHNPSDSPKVLLDAVEDTNAVYGYRPNDTGSLKKFVKYDWTDPDVVAKFRENRLRYHIENDGYRELVNSMRADGHSDVEIAKTLVEKRNANRLSSYIDENGKISDIELYN